MIFSQAISKVILSGEHAVVHGYPGVALPVFDCTSKVSICQSEIKGIEINAPQISQKFFIEKYKTECNPLELTVLNFFKKNSLEIPNLSLDIYSEIPIASGMGSGASISTAIIKALDNYFQTNLNIDQIYHQVFEIEKIYHGNPSGIDPKVIVYQSPFYFIKNVEMQKIDIKTNFEIVIIDSHLRSTTKEVVEWVGDQYKLYPDKYSKIFQSIAEISNNLKNALENNSPLIDIANLLNDNQRYLQEMGVSNDSLDSIVNICLKSGALGAKMSGAGKGGIVIALVEPENKNNFIFSLQEQGLNSVIANSS